MTINPNPHAAEHNVRTTIDVDTGRYLFWFPTLLADMLGVARDTWLTLDDVNRGTCIPEGAEERCFGPSRLRSLDYRSAMQTGMT